MRVFNDTLVSQSISLASPWISEPLSVEHIMQYSVQLFFSGAVSGAFYLDCSNDSINSLDGPTRWTEIEGSEQIITEPGDHTYDVHNVGYNWVRIRWNPNFAGGTLESARMNGKGV